MSGKSYVLLTIIMFNRIILAVALTSMVHLNFIHLSLMLAASAIGPWPNTIQMALRKLTSRLNLNMHTKYLTQLMKMKLPLTKNSPWVDPLHLACKRLKMRRDRTLRVPINGLICIKPRSILR